MEMIFGILILALFLGGGLWALGAGFGAAFGAVFYWLRARAERRAENPARLGRIF
jgi:hypothetical protein